MPSYPHRRRGPGGRGPALVRAWLEAALADCPNVRLCLPPPSRPAAAVHVRRTAPRPSDGRRGTGDNGDRPPPPGEGTERPWANPPLPQPPTPGTSCGALRPFGMSTRTRQTPPVTPAGSSFGFSRSGPPGLVDLGHPHAQVPLIRRRQRPPETEIRPHGTALRPRRLHPGPARPLGHERPGLHRHPSGRKTASSREARVLAPDTWCAGETAARPRVRRKTERRPGPCAGRNVPPAARCPRFRAPGRGRRRSPPRTARGSPWSVWPPLPVQAARSPPLRPAPRTWPTSPKR